MHLHSTLPYLCTCISHLFALIFSLNISPLFSTSHTLFFLFPLPPPPPSLLICLFIYHYFSMMLFVCLATSYQSSITDINNIPPSAEIFSLIHLWWIIPFHLILLLTTFKVNRWLTTKASYTFLQTLCISSTIIIFSFILREHLNYISGLRELPT